MSQRELKDLAYRIFQLTRRQIWLGGAVTTKIVQKDYINTVVTLYPTWPEDMDKPDFVKGVTWTMSPPVDLGGHQIRVCVYSSPRSGGTYGVRVFVDGDLKYPGGTYMASDWWFFAQRFPSWAGRIARMEREDGGVSGPVDRRDLIIAEAKNRIYGPDQVAHPKLIESSVLDPEAVAAIREVEELVNKLPRPLAPQRTT